MRWKMPGDNSNIFKCCWCCHVRTGTIIIGVFALLIEVSLLALVSVVVYGNDVTTSLNLPQETDRLTDALDASIWNKQNWSSDDKFVGFVAATSCLTMTVMLIYGAIKARPSYMMPFMGLQVFDFCMSSLVLVSYFSYVPDIKRWIDKQEWFPYKECILKINTDVLMLSVVLAFVAMLVIKAYIMGVVWSCYKYLNQQERDRASTHVLRAYLSTDRLTTLDDTEALLPPKYEDIAHLPAAESATPPPPYSTN